MFNYFNLGCIWNIKQQQRNLIIALHTHGIIREQSNYRQQMTKNL